MKTKLATGLSKNESSLVAAKEAVSAAKKKLGDKQINLSIVYCSSRYDYQKVVDVVRKATNNALLIGASSTGEFNEEKDEKGSVAVGLLASDEIKAYIAIAENVKENPEAAIKKIAAKLPKEVKDYPFLTAIFHVDGLAGVGEEITLLASYHFGKKTKIVGGAAGDDFQMKKTFVFYDDKIYSDSICVCLLASKMPFFTGIKHGHMPLTRALKITKAKGNVLYEINNKPAWNVWKQETSKIAGKKGIDVEQLKTSEEIAQFFTNYILGLATEKEGEYKIRWPLNMNKDGSLNFACGIAEGAIFRIMDGSNLEDQINSAEEAVKMARQSAENAGYSEFAGILVFDCAHRQLMLGDRFSEAVDRFKKVLPNVPLLGWETYGEILLDPGQFSGFHNTTSVVMVIPKNNKGI